MLATNVHPIRAVASSHCAACAVRGDALCGSLGARARMALNRIGRCHSFARGEVVVWSGDRSPVCANIVTGALKLAAAAPDGRERLVGLLFADDFVGDAFTADASVTATALADTELCVFARDAFERLLGDHPHMARLLLRRALASLDEARGRILMLGHKNAGEKVAGFLIDMADRLPGASRDRFELPLGRAQIADFLGLTIETVSRQMTKLRLAGLIALPGGRAITILDRAGLAAAA